LSFFLSFFFPGCFSFIRKALIEVPYRITNGGIEGQTAKIEALAAESYFGCVVISEAVGVEKPDPEIFAPLSPRNRLPFPKQLIR